MKIFVLKFYTGYLLFCSLILMIFILAGSHGKLILNNPDTQKGLAAIIIFITTGILVYFKFLLKSKANIFTIIILNLAALLILIYLANTLFYPDVFTILSTLFFCLQLAGIFCGAATIYFLIIEIKINID